MATQKEIVARIQAQTEILKAIEAGMKKVGTEEQRLVLRIEELKVIVANQGNASPELVAAVDAADSQLGKVSAALRAVDEQVEDAPDGGGDGGPTPTPAPPS